jgi:hypothetical protein
MPAYHLTTFSVEVTPPLGHPLCGGWIEPARAVDDPLRALGVVLLGAGAPIVLCAVDWCGIRNDANQQWREALAKAAHTTADRVTVHAVHPHNAPFADVEAQRLLEQVASNRRILGPDNKWKATRYSATKDPAIRAEPEGLIDPWLRTLSFWDGERPLAALHYYATHPMSYYGDGRVTSDFCGLARDKRRQDDPGVFQVYFTGCAGNITAGKYNDGAKENRPVLRDRVHDAMVAAWKATERAPLDSLKWRIEPMRFRPRREPGFGEEKSREALKDDKAPKAKRGNAAFQLAWLKRIDRPIELTCLDLGKAAVVHLPGEPFIEYQLEAQKLRPDLFVCVAGYGDGGPGYIPTDRAFLEGGYEPTVALADPCQEPLTRAIARLLEAKERDK